MSSNTQEITIVGNLTNDPDLRFTSGGSAVANFTVAKNVRYFATDRSEWVDAEPLFFRCNVWRDQAENVAATLRKGMRVIVTGNMQSRSFETKEGEKRTVTEITVEEIGPSLRWSFGEMHGMNEEENVPEETEKPAQQTTAKPKPRSNSRR